MVDAYITKLNRFARTAHLQRGKTSLSTSVLNITQKSDVKVLVMLELCGMRIATWLPSLPGPLWPRVVAPDKNPIYGLNRNKRWLEFTNFFFFCI